MAARGSDGVTLGPDEDIRLFLTAIHKCYQRFTALVIQQTWLRNLIFEVLYLPRVVATRSPS